MVFLGHPLYTGYNKATISPLLGLISIVKEDNAWITTIEEVAEFRKNLADLCFYVEKDDGIQYIRVVAENNAAINDVCINVTGKVNSATATRGNVQIKAMADTTQLIFDASDGQVISMNLE
jgi:hypothetical protein